MLSMRVNGFELVDEGHEHSGVAREEPTGELIDRHLLSCPRGVAVLASESKHA